jgi:hypothetical protein
LPLPATPAVDPVAEVVCELGLAALAASPLAFGAPCVPEAVVVAGLLLVPVAAVLLLLPAAPLLRPEVEPVVAAGGPTGLWFQSLAGLGGCVVVGGVVGSCWAPPVPAVPLLPLPLLGAPAPVLGAGAGVADGVLEAALPSEMPTVRGPGPLVSGAPA